MLELILAAVLLLFMATMAAVSFVAWQMVHDQRKYDRLVDEAVDEAIKEFLEKGQE